MTERQKIIARKLARQSAKNKLKQISGIALLKLFGENENPALNELCSAYFSTFEYNLEPYSKLPYKSPKEKIFSSTIFRIHLCRMEKSWQMYQQTECILFKTESLSITYSLEPL